ncbi:MAG TPA: hypothetical protein VIK74_06105, partial [Parasegetibacter sp.]
LNEDWMMDKMLNTFAFGGANLENVYFDEENRRHLNTIRQSYADLANHLADLGRKEDANRVLVHCDTMMREENMPYAMPSTARGIPHNYVSLHFLQAALKAGNTELGDKISAALKKDLNQQAEYYQSLNDVRQSSMRYEIGICYELLKMVEDTEKKYRMPADSSALETEMKIDNTEAN